MSNPLTGSEFDIIERYFKPLTGGHAEALNLADDAAVIAPQKGRDTVVTTDAVVSGVHFLDSLSPGDIAHKVVGVNLSDLAAMGARPFGVFLAAQFAKDISEDWIASFTQGIGEALAPSGARLLGGDTVTTPGPMAFTITALGTVREGGAILRSGAEAGDIVFVSGTIGDAALGLAVLGGRLTELAEDDNFFLARRYARPQPRVRLGMALCEGRTATAGIDVSDGLAADLRHICETSGVSMEIDASSVPLSEAARAALKHQPDLLETVLSGGDDYELAFTAPPGRRKEVLELAQEAGTPVTEIGRIVAQQTGKGPEVRVFAENGMILDLGAGGYRHF
ncbi:MAG: thiamine-phosphate kinase [Alphaproteobacteria bacterium]|nr:thiamine-phosphate kinase [Alphaproteobacteria bacterium]